MERRTFLKGSAAFAGSAVFVPGNLAASLRHYTGFTALRKHAGIFEGRGGTIGYLANADALLVVDAQFPETATRFWKNVEKAGREKIDVLLNSHHHGDHTRGNAVLSPVAHIHAAHKNVPVLQKKSAKRRGNEAAQSYASTLFESNWKKEIGNEIVSASYYGNAHTSGDIVVHFQNANVAHAGDLVFNRRPPYIDRGAGSNTKKWMAVLEKIHGQFTDDTIFVFGHSGSGFPVTGTRKDLLVMRDFLAAMNTFVGKARKAGKTESKIVASAEVPGFPDHSKSEHARSLGRALKAVYAEQLEEEK